LNTRNDSRTRNQKDEVPLTHYLSLYKTLDPSEISQRCAVKLLDSIRGAFALRLMGKDYTIDFPEFCMRDTNGEALESVPEKILTLRYLCEGRYASATGKQLSYRDIPWGEVYFRNFEGRCIKRLAFAFGNDIDAFRRIMEVETSLNAAKLPQGDAGYRFEFMSGLYMSLLLWAADDEFPPSAQILFDDNFVPAFTAEDIAVVGDIVINQLKKLQNTNH
jgi:hypothetical protein